MLSSAYLAYGKAVRDFPQGELSYSTDKLVTIGGLAAITNETLRDQYSWRRQLPNQPLQFSFDGGKHTLVHSLHVAGRGLH